jgi:hypothetical protein
LYFLLPAALWFFPALGMSVRCTLPTQDSEDVFALLNPWWETVGELVWLGVGMALMQFIAAVIAVIVVTVAGWERMTARLWTVARIFLGAIVGTAAGAGIVLLFVVLSVLW